MLTPEDAVRICLLVLVVIAAIFIVSLAVRHARKIMIVGFVALAIVGYSEYGDVLLSYVETAKKVLAALG
ncbi:MAG: hypothetical protein WC289_03095 [Patescibacteria group bacterium]|jgi:hypothetical protein